MIDPQALTLLPLWYAVFLLSLTAHEAAHAFVAYRGGDDTAYLGGQVTLNPIPHVAREPFGTVLVPLLTYMNMGWMMGWASAPYDPGWEARYPRRAAMMAAAGPAANLLLCLLGFVVLKVGLATGIWTFPYDAITLDRLVVPAEGSPAVLDGVGRLFSVMLILNLVLLVFNVLPFPPMDGAAIVAGLSSRAREIYMKFRATPISGLIGLLAAIIVFRRLFPPIRDFVLFRLYG